MKLDKINQQLREKKAGVSIIQKGQRLYLQATLPGKPKSNKLPHQQQLSLGIYANKDGFLHAKAEALRLSKLLATQSFNWGLYGVFGVTPSNTVRDLVEQYEVYYFRQRGRNPKTLTTWDKDYRLTFLKLPQDQPLTLEILIETVEKTRANSRSRKRYVMALSALAKFAEIDPEPIRGLAGHYSPTILKPRQLPNDNRIMEVRSLIKSPSWKWVYGMLACYGLRPHEIFYLNLDRLQSKDYCLEVLDGKTGPRIVYPLPVSWWEEWQLYEPILPIISGKSNSEIGNRVTQTFRRNKIPFRAYDLRHAWAVRSLMKGLDLTLASQQMGHSVAVHSQIYHHWISEAIHRAAFNQLNGFP
ncbi:tyrosine-type recombinase/integrase [Coleofasciculus sp.]|uniref:tyrosine-type recombinase/integrase n=1 Tax=Coleofasciculus sp. TaxID=3100458 RepID=UPI0039FAF7A4